MFWSNCLGVVAKIYLCLGFFIWGYIEAIVWGILCFGAIVWGLLRTVASAFVQGVKLQLSLCPGVQSSSVFSVQGGTKRPHIAVATSAVKNMKLCIINAKCTIEYCLRLPSNVSVSRHLRIH